MTILLMVIAMLLIIFGSLRILIEVDAKPGKQSALIILYCWLIYTAGFILGVMI